jgi:hypothetical protein
MSLTYQPDPTVSPETEHEEVRLLSERMATADEIDDLFLAGNAVRIRALAAERGWHFCRVEVWAAGWLRCRLRKHPPRRRLDSHPLLA